MADLVEEITQVIQEMHDLNEQAQEIGLSRNTVSDLYKASNEVGQSWSKSWLGYQANVYYRNFRTPGEGDYFSRRRWS